MKLKKIVQVMALSSTLALNVPTQQAQAYVSNPAPPFTTASYMIDDATCGLVFHLASS